MEQIILVRMCSMIAPAIETARLRLRPFTLEDTEALHRLWTDPEVRRYLWDDVVIPEEQTRGLIRQSLASFQAHRFGLWAVLPRGAADLIGFGGYWYFHDPPELQLLYGLAPAWWGRGLATECAEALIRYGFETLGLAAVTGSTDAPNLASRRVMEKAGMRWEKQVEREGKRTVYYRIERPAQMSGRARLRTEDGRR